MWGGGGYLYISSAFFNLKTICRVCANRQVVNVHRSQLINFVLISFGVKGSMTW